MPQQIAERETSLPPADCTADPASAKRLPHDRKAGLALAAIAPLALEACEGGSTSGTAAASPTPPPTPLTAAQASRFLGQATMGASKADITNLQASSIDAWLTTQLGLARPQTFWDFLAVNGYNIPANQGGWAGLDAMAWAQLMGSADTLRQRVGMALADIIVVAYHGLPNDWRPNLIAAYLDILWDNAFGNYRDILDGIAGNFAMGLYLSFVYGLKGNPTTGAIPDENFARELMQLFTIGLYKLNPDGTQILSGGKPIETYNQDDVSGGARVWTGWLPSTTDSTTPERARAPMIASAARHETGVTNYLGTTIPAGTDAPTAKKIVLDLLFAHPNLPPFIGKQLIQRLVTSNPSPAYIGRVSAVFANNGNGVRGDMKAIIRAILTDTEARSDSNLTSPTFGKLREPVMRLTQWARAFGVTSPTNLWPFGDTSSLTTALGQSPGRASSVFSFFRPTYTPPGSDISAKGLVAPEFQLVNEPSVVGYINFMQNVIANGAGEAKPNYSSLTPLIADSQALLDELNLVLAANQISAATIATLKTALDTVNVTTAAGQNTRLYSAILLVMSAPEYLAQK